MLNWAVVVRELFVCLKDSFTDYPENYFNQNRIERWEAYGKYKWRTWEAPLAPLYASVVGMWLWCFLVPSLSYFFPSASVACFNSSSAKGLQSVQVWKGVFGLRVKWFFNQRGKKAGDGVYPIEFNQWSVISKWRQSLWQGSAQLI